MHSIKDADSIQYNSELLDESSRLTRPRSPNRWRVVFAIVILCLFGSIISPLRTSCGAPEHIRATLNLYHPRALFSTDANGVANPLLRVFQVYPPVLVPSSSGASLTNGSSLGYQVPLQLKKEGCVVTQTLMVHSFANSYSKPFVGTYTPPTCKFNRVTFNFTVTSAGRQFDRLAIAYFGDTEIWRTSTAEPTSTGIIWTYVKDMSNYLALFKTQQKLIFDLGNLVDSTYTAPYDTVLQATFFTSEDTVVPADRIETVSSMQGANNQGSVFQVQAGQQNASSTLTLPRNIEKAVFTVSATGQIDEEFWFGNVLQSDLLTFGAGALLGASPFREVQLLIDGQLAGVVWPFPIIFTGGVVPGLWRPIVGIDAFDLREGEIDITPWLPLLCNGKSHTFQIIVAGLQDDGKGQASLSEMIGSYWLVTGKIFIWEDRGGSITTGNSVSSSVPAPLFHTTQTIGKNSTGGNETLAYSVSASRQLVISSTIRTSAGTRPVFWSQSLSYNNNGNFTNYGNNQVTTQNTDGYDVSSENYARHYSYPLSVTTNYKSSNNGANLFISGLVNRAQNIQSVGEPVFPTGLQSFGPLPGVANDYPAFQGSSLQTSQNGSAIYQSTNNGKNSSSSGSTTQEMVFSGIQINRSTPSRPNYPQVTGSKELYQRSVTAVNGTVTQDNESLTGTPFTGFSGVVPDSGSTLKEVAFSNVRKLLGRGPGNNLQGTP